MALIRSKFSQRMVFLSFAGLLLLLTLAAIKSEDTPGWKAIQETYQRHYQTKILEQARAAEAAGNSADLAKWQLLLRENQAGRTGEIRQIFLPDAGVRDLCGTCHLAMENPLFKDSPNPLRAHPPDLLKHHPLNRFGCSLCHHGQGTALSADKAHGFEKNWPKPRVPLKFVQGLCFGCHASAFGLSGAEKAAEGEGLFVDHGCYGCHSTPATDKLPAMATPLDNIGAKVQTPAWLFHWIQDPASIRPRTRMPAFQLEPAAARHITAFLVTQQQSATAASTGNPGQGKKSQGQSLFTEKGCIACHAVAPEQAALTDRVPNLADAGLKLSPQWTAAWLAKPAGLIPRTSMPRVPLSDEEIAHLGAYLVSLQARSVADKLSNTGTDDPAGGDAAEGKKLIQVFGCYGCHPIEALADPPKVGLEVAAVARKRLEELPFGHNTSVPRTKWDWLLAKIKQPDLFKTEDMPLRMPNYLRPLVFNEAQAEALTVFYLNQGANLPENYHHKPRQETAVNMQGSFLTTHYNCLGCHQLAEEQKPRIAEHLALKSMIPPRLIGEGQRVQPQWFFQFLSRPGEMRPWLKMRMPEFAFTYAEKTALIDYFIWQSAAPGKDRPEAPYVLLPVQSDFEAESLQMGEYRLVTDKCMQCHPVNQEAALPQDVKVEDLSINLMLAKSRLRFEWIKNFLRNPDQYSGKDTKMPFVYYTPDKVPRIPDPEMWIEYTARFLMFMDRTPEIKQAKQVEALRPGSEVDWTSY